MDRKLALGILTLALCGGLSAQMVQQTIAGGLGVATAVSNPAFVNQSTAGSCGATSGTTLTCSMVGGTNITAGHQLTFLLYGWITTETFVSATGCSTTWTQKAASNTNKIVQLYFCSNATGGANSITVTTSTINSTGLYGSVVESSGVVGTTDASITNNGSGSVNWATTGSATITNATDLCVAAFDGALSAPTFGNIQGWSALNNPSGGTTRYGGAAYVVTTSTAGLNYTVTSGGYSSPNAFLDITPTTFPAAGVDGTTLVSSGVTPSGYNGTNPAAVVSSNQLFWASSNPGAYVSGGTVNIPIAQAVWTNGGTSYDAALWCAY
jgi:hypothetical protein